MDAPPLSEFPGERLPVEERIASEAGVVQEAAYAADGNPSMQHFPLSNPNAIEGDLSS